MLVWRSAGLCFFFFSSRRRHTRYWRDWSSDVCSSDLFYPMPPSSTPLGSGEPLERLAGYRLGHGVGAVELPVADRVALARSEERRVGKECRSRWSPYH